MSDFRDAITTVAVNILATERAIDNALARAASTMASVLDTRPQTMAAADIQPHIDRLLQMLGGISDQRAELLRFHGAMGKLAEREGYSPQAHGDWWPCPSAHADRVLTPIQPVPQAA
ncbi:MULTISPECIES: hypothetical protein [unclassified Sphingomonas]|uniref:hypothetical protein n=1 Tax=unclassified Sphingomonas TaxID=196159 RepID=UPI000A710FE7|nr:MULTISPECIES: hypothetical protein [unclassified Sphingomonas]